MKPPSKLIQRPELLVGIIAIAVTLVSAIVTVISSEVRGMIIRLGEYPEELALVAVSTAAIVLLVVLILQRKRRILSGFRRQRFTRFEQIQNLPLRFGHVEFYPFLYYGRPNGDPVGIGVDLLTELFGDTRLIPWHTRATWEDMLIGLVRGNYEIIATPLLETWSRCELVAYSMPMFFADIGIFARPDVLGLGQELTLESAIQALETVSDDLHLEVIRGEISELLANQYINLPSSSQMTIYSGGQQTLQSLLTGLADYERPGNLVFAERFLGELATEITSGHVVNILRPGEILYPVGFAMRREEHVLRSFVNLRLIELEDSYEEGILGFFANQMRQQQGFEHVDLEMISQTLVRKKHWPTHMGNPDLPLGT